MLLALSSPCSFPSQSCRSSGSSWKPACFAIGPGAWRGLALSVCLQVDTASEVEELEADSVSLLPAAPEGSRAGARIQVFLARYRWAPPLCSPHFPSIWGVWEEGAG